MSNLNVANRTLAVMDNLLFLRALNNECIDLIAIDPPFAANETFTSQPKPPITEAELAEEMALAELHGVAHDEGIGGTRVRDVWTWDHDIHTAWMMKIQYDFPAVHAVITAVEACATENEAAYIAFMAVRLIECRRVLKDTGSIYIHCDDHANSYLRMLLDAIFGAGNFRNEIIWLRRQERHNLAVKQPGRAHDSILYYAKSKKSKYNIQYEPYSPEYIEENYKYQDERGRYGTFPCTNESGGNRPYEFMGITRAWRYEPERMAQMYRDGMLTQAKPNSPFRYKKYLDEAKGVKIQDVWTNLKPARGEERTGYATQKPLALYERIINASSEPGDVVLDVFAGCATTAVAAEQLGRQWVACDMAYRSWTMLKRRFYLNGYALSDMTDATRAALGDHQPQLPQYESYTIGPNSLPQRADIDPDPYHQLPVGRRGKRTIQSATWSGRIPKAEAKKKLIEHFGPVCWGCGFKPSRPNGTLDDTLLEVDHIRAKKSVAGTGGDDELYNLALLHRTCNGIKGNKLTLEDLRKENEKHGRLYVDRIEDLVDLFEAQQFAQDQIARHVATHGY